MARFVSKKRPNRKNNQRRGCFGNPKIQHRDVKKIPKTIKTKDGRTITVKVHIDIEDKELN
jgi:hypothetical protein